MPKIPTIPPLPGFTVLGLTPDPVARERKERAAKRLAGDLPPGGLFEGRTGDLIDLIRKNEKTEKRKAT